MHRDVLRDAKPGRVGSGVGAQLDSGVSSVIERLPRGWDSLLPSKQEARNVAFFCISVEVSLGHAIAMHKHTINKDRERLADHHQRRDDTFKSKKASNLDPQQAA